MDSFTELEVWQKAHRLVLKIYKLTAGFPNAERFRLTDQLCRSASSIPANIVHPVEYAVLSLFHGARAKAVILGRNTCSSYISFTL